RASQPHDERSGRRQALAATLYATLIATRTGRKNHNSSRIPRMPKKPIWLPVRPRPELLPDPDDDPDASEPRFALASASSCSNSCSASALYVLSLAFCSVSLIAAMRLNASRRAAFI